MITYPTTVTHADIPAEVRHSYGLTDDFLRLSIGIEDADDLIDDLKQALRLKMTKYDFTTLPNRLTHHTYKWKETETDPAIIPAWIADMDFNVIPEVREAVIGYADQMVYGYTYASDSLYQSIPDWEKRAWLFL